MAKELNDLLSVTSAKALSCAELVRDFRIVCSIIHWQLSEDTVAKVDIDDFVVLTGREESIAWIVGCGSDPTGITLTGLLGSLTRILNLTNLVPLVLCITPHVGKSNAILFENLDKAI